MDGPAYRCSVCGLAVIVLPGEKPIRACACVGTILCEASAVVTAHNLTGDHADPQ